MNNLSKVFLIAGAGLAYCLPAAAFDLVSPVEGEVYKVASLSKIDLKWSENVNDFPEKTLQVLDASGNEVSVNCGMDQSWDDWDVYIATFTPAITTPGTYTVIVPANMAGDNNNKEYRLTYEVEGAVANPDGAVPTAVDPVDGTDIVQAEDVFFDKIRLVFGNAESLTVNQTNISLTDQTGTAVEFTISGFYQANDPMLQYQEHPFVCIDFNLDGNMPSGTYTLSIKPGAFTDQNGSINETAIDYTYTYTKTKADVDDTPLEITSALMGGVIDNGSSYSWVGTNAVEVTPDMQVAEFVGVLTVGEGKEGTGFLLTFNHGEKAEYVTYNLIDASTSETVYNSTCIKQEDNSYLIPWISTVKLLEDTKYRLEFHAYDNAYNMTEFGNGAELTFEGLSEAYKFSPAEFVTVVPSPGTVLTTLDQNKITVLFTQPVKVTSNVILGSSVTQDAKCESANEKEYDNVWYVYIPASLMATYPDAIVNVFAKDENGLVVNGNQGWESSACNQFEYTMTICLPRLLLGQTNTHVSELSTFFIYSADGRGVETSWLEFPYVIDVNGVKVAELNMEAYTDEWGDKTPFKALSWTSTSEDRMPLELEFQITPAITMKGQYSLVLPSGSFNIGTQFESEFNAPKEYDFWVTEFFPVSYTTDNNTVALSPVEITKSASLSIETKENWKLETLTLNGKDVTADVANGRYVSPAATEAMNFEATFAYDGVVVTPTGVDDIVTDLNLRGWSVGGKLYVAGLKDGQIVNVYTVGGSAVANATVAGGDDTLEFTLGKGIYIVTVTEGAQTVALKLVNE